MIYEVHIGDVLAMPDRRRRTAEPMPHICVAVEYGIFFRVNEHPLFKPHFTLSAIECEWLARDSFVELNRPYEFTVGEISEVISSGGHLGKVGPLQLRDLASEIQKAKTLAMDMKENILGELKQHLTRTDENIWDFN